MYGKSTMRQTLVNTGQVRLKKHLDPQHFAEGSTRLGDKVYQITWKSGAGFIYRASDLTQVLSLPCLVFWVVLLGAPAQAAAGLSRRSATRTQGCGTAGG